MSAIRSVCVYCGSSPGAKASYLEQATKLGTRLGQKRFDLVYGGGTKGLMGAVSSAAAAYGSKVTGIIPKFLMSKEAVEADLHAVEDLIIVETMHQRKHLLFEKSDAFIALPGGIGTLEEVVEIMTWAQLGRHTKPIIFCGIDGFWEPMRFLFEHMKAEAFIHSQTLLKPTFANTVEEAISILTARPATSDGNPAVIERL
ncbi:TIGR00730 family Rossman fold protein [Limoniibacter endophyticus]|uniref:Cytokinin riboside 5'-monophosphate phosphoribohydrolase n=1 Tax=Limoniibacter endophyticus TaxID=1565040 RepID=A0A8J3GH09_9HYPH|nr:TIGR00730 family Rossman fold protein [Limoniibacter endophyticus]GHC68917.1 cytokinin riboside 5'-monophosphate phosphoribohydrolase [Limoniibacter endophyticus]